jgi:hypothetical protein
MSWAPVAHIYNPSDSVGRDQKDYDLKPSRANSSQDLMTLFQKFLTQNRAGRVAQVVECLYGKSEVLSSSSRTTKKKRKEK